jgi:uncharacterized protein (TIGR02246 family)
MLLCTRHLMRKKYFLRLIQRLAQGLLIGACSIVAIDASAQSTCTAQPQLQHILDEQQAAWNNGDGAGFSAAFTDDSDFINIRGDAFHGRAAITAQHDRIFAGPFAGSHTVITIRQCTDLAPGLALVETVHEVSGFKFLPPGIIPTSPGILKTRMKYIARKQGDAWHLIAAQNTAILPAMGPPPPH